MKRRIFVALSIVLCGSAPLFAQISFTNWHTPAQIDTIMSDLQTAHPTRCLITTVGTSGEGRAIKAIKISDNVGTNETSEGDVVIMATHHAREWLSTETALYIAEQLLTRYATDPQIQADVDALQIWVIPVVNPDGFHFTQTPANRFWRKNRRNNGDGTFGVDPNRNWGYEWGRNDGSSPDTWVDTYRGPFAWSEPEILALRNFLQGLNNLKTLLTYHSFTQLFLRPWGWTTADAPGEPTLQLVAQRNIAAIQAVHGVTYTETIGYNASGETTDYLWGQMRVSAFTPEVRPVSLAAGGFNPPTSVILPNVEENFAAARALIHDAGSREVWIRDYLGDTGAEPSAVWTGSGWSQAFWLSPDITTVPAALVEGTTVTLNIRVHNNAGAPRQNVRVDAYWTDPRVSLEFPNPTATLIGSQTVNVPPAGKTVSMSWTVPTGTNSWGERHWCVGAVIMHERDMPLTTQAQRSSNVAIRNFETTEAAAGSNLVVAATNFLEVDAELVLYVNPDLPRGWRVFPPRLPRADVRKPTAIQRKARLLDATGPLLTPGETIYLPVRIIPPRNAKPGDSVDVHIHAALLPLLPGKREAVGNGFTYRVVVPRERSPRR